MRRRYTALICSQTLALDLPFGAGSQSESRCQKVGWSNRSHHPERTPLLGRVTRILFPKPTLRHIRPIVLAVLVRLPRIAERFGVGNSSIAFNRLRTILRSRLCSMRLNGLSLSAVVMPCIGVRLRDRAILNLPLHTSLATRQPPTLARHPTNVRPMVRRVLDTASRLDNTITRRGNHRRKHNHQSKLHGYTARQVHQAGAVLLRCGPRTSHLRDLMRRSV